MPPPPHVLPGLRRPVDLQALIKAIVVSPEANSLRLEETSQLVSDLGYTIPVQGSVFTQYPHVVIDLEEIIRFSGQ